MRSWRRPVFSAVAALAICATPALAAGDAPGGTSLVFGEKQLAGLEPGEELIYAHRRSLPEGAAGNMIRDGEIRLAVARSETGAEARVSVGDEGRTRRLDPFPMAGNPILLVFLESSLRAIAEVTGGSPFYLRNRIREAFREGAEAVAVTAETRNGTVPAERIVYRPFEQDAHVAELGAFREMELEFVLSEAVPGRFVSLAASTGAAGFREEVRLVGEEH